MRTRTFYTDQGRLSVWCADEDGEAELICALHSAHKALAVRFAFDSHALAALAAEAFDQTTAEGVATHIANHPHERRH